MIYFIVNESSKSGKAKEIVHDVLMFFKNEGYEYKAFITKYEGHASEMAEKIVKKEYIDFKNKKKTDAVRIVVLGGDGTINEVVNGIMAARDYNAEIDSFAAKNVYISVYPTGSGNDFIRGANLNRTKEELFYAVTDGYEDFRATDIGKVTFSDGNTRYFAISTGMGMDALVCRKAEKSMLKKLLNIFGMGKLTYIILTVQTIFSMDYSFCEIEYETVDNGVITTHEKTLDQMIYIAVLNLFAEGGGVPMAPNAVSNDGELDICAAYGLSRGAGFLKLPILAKGKHEGKKGFFTERVKSITIKNDAAMTVHTDGEDMLDRDYMKVECIKGGLNVL
ncbi:MAG: hypothetical protein K6D02_00660 [Lachnospiraceae bacterium]|nr:hypothetical protein [Lachnospiraceae bacterium]